jgi:protein-disulfide isomerase
MKIIYKSIIILLSAILLFNSNAAAEVVWESGLNLQLTETPVEVVLSEDGKWSFVLTEQHNVLIYSMADGMLVDSIPVPGSTTDIDISATGEFLFLVNRGQKVIQGINIDFIKQIDITDAPFMGMADAPVTIVLFSDFQCPYCSKMGSFFDEVFARYPDKIKLVYKNFPLRFHQYAAKAALAALAADKQGRFWEFHDLLFKHSKELSDKKVEEITKELGLDYERLKKDMNSPAIRQRLQQDMNDGAQAGVTGTPTVFVNGRELKKRSLENISKLIDEAIKKAADLSRPSETAEE